MRALKRKHAPPRIVLYRGIALVADEQSLTVWRQRDCRGLLELRASCLSVYVPWLAFLPSNCLEHWAGDKSGQKLSSRLAHGHYTCHADTSMLRAWLARP